MVSPTSDYLSLVLSFPNVSPVSVFIFFLLGLMRIAPIVALAPFLGAKLPQGVKMGLVITLTAVMLPHIVLTSSTPAALDVKLLGYIFKELFIGILLGFMVSIPFYFSQAAGVLIDFMRGSSSLGVTDPTTQAQITPIGLLYNYVLIVLFFQIDGPFYFFDGVVQSYTAIPVDKFFQSAFFTLDTPFWQAMLKLLTQFTVISIQLAAPSIVAILMAEMFLGIANRLAPQVQIAFLGMSLKSLLGIALLWAGWFFIMQQMAKQSLQWLRAFSEILYTIKT